RIGVEKIGEIRLRRDGANETHECTREGVLQWEIRQFVVDVAIDDDDVVRSALRFPENPPQVDRIEQIESVADQAKVPGANVLVATLDRFVRGADSALAAVHLVYETFTVEREHNDVVPEGEHSIAKAKRFRKGA